LGFWYFKNVFVTSKRNSLEYRFEYDLDWLNAHESTQDLNFNGFPSEQTH
jgi:hypothetical protein